MLSNRAETKRVRAMKKAIGYIRVSTEQQASEGVSLDAQRSKIVGWCKANDYDLVVVLEDAGVSGGADVAKRPGLSTALDAVKRHKADALVVAHRDRLARDTEVVGEVKKMLRKMRARIIAVDGMSSGIANDDQPEAILVQGMEDLLSQHWRMVIKAKTKAALAYKKAQGEKYAPVPFGFREVEGRLVTVEKEARVVSEILKQRKAGRTLAEIAEDLNGRGIEGKRGGRWYPSTVRYLIQRQAA